ncbi:MAG TPA: BTAD domain-containing putative transcriptional regulator [Nocardioides sp.]|nr:BTAD domain-containing putative transcriptional regulator [Nocardioides sp.]
MHLCADLRIQLLGSLHVTRADGTSVPPDTWRTGKTMDLLRLLALNNGRPVRPTSLIQKLWPDALPERARGSLRTACSQIRRATGVNCVVRHPDGLVLTGASVDAVELREAGRRSALAAAWSNHTQVVAIARVTERLYFGDFHAHDDDSDWARIEREQLRHVRLDLLRDAAASAYTLHRYREAMYFARTAVLVDPHSESAQRLLMQAHAAVGEVGSALQVFESYRAYLADELGADPAPETQALHLQLLRGSTA